MSRFVVHYIFIQIEALLNFETKFDLTGSTGFIVLLRISFGWFQLSFKTESMVLSDIEGGLGWFCDKSGLFPVVLTHFGWFWLILAGTRVFHVLKYGTY